MAKTKVGEKGRHVQLPDGWVRVQPPARLGDRFLEATTFAQTGAVRWLDVTDEDLDWDTFDCLIRKEDSGAAHQRLDRQPPGTQIKPAGA